MKNEVFSLLKSFFPSTNAESNNLDDTLEILGSFLVYINFM